jgi:hypothetical protein
MPLKAYKNGRICSFLAWFNEIGEDGGMSMPPSSPIPGILPGKTLWIGEAVKRFGNKNITKLER